MLTSTRARHSEPSSVELATARRDHCQHLRIILVDALCLAEKSDGNVAYGIIYTPTDVELVKCVRFGIAICVSARVYQHGLLPVDALVAETNTWVFVGWPQSPIF